MNKLMYIGPALVMTSLVACGGDSEETAIDQQLLTEYRAAIPPKERLMASAPEASASAKVGDPAMFPQGSYDIVTGVNGAVTGIVETMRAIVELPPTLYNSDTKEFFWGPVPNEDGFGTVAAYIKDAGEGAEFRYQYALLRGVDKDVAKLSPVIWGGATPDATKEDYGAGVTLWDFEANKAFEKANNPDFDGLPLDSGRFAAAYSKGAEGEGELAAVVSVFRGFVPKDKPEAAPADLNYFYGRWANGTTTIDFVDWQSAFNIDNDPARLAVENVGVHMAFLNEGTGRAEAEASEGDLAAGQVANVVECWNDALAETYVSFKTTTNGVEDGSVADGDVKNCGLFEATLAELGVPSLSDLGPELLAELDKVAKNGVPKE